MADIDQDNYTRCHIAMQVLCSTAVSCIEETLKQWHQGREILPSCRSPSGCPSKGKPKPNKGSCPDCVQWGKAVEGALYNKYEASSIPWKNVNPTLLGRDPVELAKAFMLRLPQDQVYRSIGDFDVASILMIMKRFNDFHKGDIPCHDLIKKVSDIRNSLSHMKISGNLYVDSTTLTDYFRTIIALVNNLGRIQPSHFTQQCTQDLKSELNDILIKPITTYMKTEAFKPFSQAMEEVVRQTIQENYQEMREEWKSLPQTVQANLNPQLENLVAATEQIPSFVEQSIGCQIEALSVQTSKIPKVVQESLKAQLEAVSDETRRGLKRVSSEVSDLASSLKRKATEEKQSEAKGKLFDPPVCRTQLMLEYRESRGKVPLLPGMPEECANIDDIYVDMELLQDLKTSSGKAERQLNSHEELLVLKDDNGFPLNRILVRGGPGAGKSTTVSKLAYDWATHSEKPCFSKYQLLFALDLREIKSDMDIIDAIQDQLLPKVYRQGLESYIESQASSVVYLFDGYDEASKVLQHKDIKNMLSNKWLQESPVIVTTRPHKIAEYIRCYGMCTHVQLLPFSFDHIAEYVCRFFQILPYIDYVMLELEKNDQDIEVIDSIDNKKYFELVEHEVYDDLDEDEEQDDDEDSNNEEEQDDDDDEDNDEAGKEEEVKSASENDNNISNDKKANKNDQVYDDIQKTKTHPYLSVVADDKPGTSDDDMLQQSKEIEPPPKFKEKVVDDAILLLKQIEVSPNIASLSEIPAMLTMICLLWGATRELPDTMTNLYEEATLYLAKHKEVKYDGQDLDIDKIKQFLKSILVPIGKVAITGLFEDRLTFQSSEFDSHLLEKSCHLGLLSKERKKSKLQAVEHIMFLHKTFQEMCAGVYLGYLFDSNREKFDEYLRKISTEHISDMALLLRFCCGVGTRASEVVLPHVVQLSHISLTQLGELACLGAEDTEKDPWMLPLLLQLESGSKALSKDLQPLFQNPDINIFLDRNIEKLSAFDFFLNSELSALRQSVMTSVNKASITIKSSHNILDKSCTEVVVKVFTMLLSCLTQIQSLVLDTSFMNDFGVLSFDETKRLAESFRKLKSLANLDIDGNGNVNALIKAFHTGTSSLTKENLKELSVNCSFTVKAMADFVSHLSLKSLSITAHTISKEETEQILYGAKGGQLQELAFNDCEISADSLKPHIPNLHVLIIVSGQKRQLREGKQIFGTFSDIGSRLEDECCVSGNTAETLRTLPFKQLTLISTMLSLGAVRSLTESFKYTPCLQYLRLTDAGLNEKCVVLIATSLHYLPNLLQIDLQGNRVGHAACDLSENFQNVAKLQILNLSYVALNEEDISIISKSLIHIPKLQELDLSENNTSDAVKDLSHNFCRVAGLKELRLTSASMSEKGKQEMCSHMHHLSFLEKLDLSLNPGFPMSGLAKGIESLATLKELALDECNLSDDFLTMLSWSRFGHLTYLSLGGENQLYGPEGVECLFKNLHHLEFLATLILTYQKRWHESSLLFNECWHACSLEEGDMFSDNREFLTNPDTQNNLTMLQREIRSVKKFVKEYTRIQIQ